MSKNNSFSCSNRIRLLRWIQKEIRLGFRTKPKEGMKHLLKLKDQNQEV